MKADDWKAIVKQMNLDVRGILKAQQVMSDVHSELRVRAEAPIEEDFIHEDSIGKNLGEPRTVSIDGLNIDVRVLHRRGLRQSDIKGADLLYEIKDRKFALVQYKTPDGQGRIHGDIEQLRKLIAACPNPCPPSRQGYWPTCGSWFVIRGPTEALYLPACEAQAIFGDAGSRSAGSFASGVSAETFQELFGRCWVGARTAASELLLLLLAAIQQDHVLLSVIQRGTFGR